MKAFLSVPSRFLSVSAVNAFFIPFKPNYRADNANYTAVIQDYTHVIKLYMRVIKDYMHVILNYACVILNYMAVILNYMAVILNYMAVILNYMAVIKDYTPRNDDYTGRNVNYRRVNGFVSPRKVNDSLCNAPGGRDNAPLRSRIGVIFAHFLPAAATVPAESAASRVEKRTK